MSAYDNVVVGKLRLKGKALVVKAGGIKKKNKQKKQYDASAYYLYTVCKCIRKFKNPKEHSEREGGNKAMTNLTDATSDEGDIEQKQEEADKYGHLTPAERKYLQQWEKINLKRLAEEATKSHRDRIQEFNQYLANLSEHYDIPKVGPG